MEPFGLLAALGILGGTLVGAHRMHAVGLDVRVTPVLALWVLLPALVVAHLVSAVLYFPDKLAANPWYLLALWDDISSFGGFVGGAAGAVAFFHYHRIPKWAYGDCIVYGLAFGWLFGRLGCAVVFDHRGHATDFVLGMPYPAALDGLPAGTVRHNLGLYEWLWQLVIFGLMFAQRKRPRFAGFYVVVPMLAYAPARFALDFLRVADRTYLGLTAGQLSAVLMFGLGIWLLRSRKAVGETVVVDGRIHRFADGRTAIPDAHASAVPRLRWLGHQA